MSWRKRIRIPTLVYLNKCSQYNFAEKKSIQKNSMALHETVCTNLAVTWKLITEKSTWNSKKIQSTTLSQSDVSTWQPNPFSMHQQTRSHKLNASRSCIEPYTQRRFQWTQLNVAANLHTYKLEVMNTNWLTHMNC